MTWLLRTCLPGVDAHYLLSTGTLARFSLPYQGILIEAT